MNATDQAWLEKFLEEHDGVAGTVHRTGAGGILFLAGAVNVPAAAIALIDRIPCGKGMAGLAFERNEPVSTCNIQTDETGQVRPGAKLVGAQAGVALPVRDSNGSVRAVVGIAYREERTILESELALLQAAASRLP